MNKSLKQILVFLALVIIIQLLSSPIQSIGQYTYKLIKSNLATMGVEIEASEANFRLPIQLLIPNSEITLKNQSNRKIVLQNLSLALSTLELFKLKRSFMLSTNLYQGQATLNLTQGLFSQSSLLVDADIEHIDIASTFADKRFKGELTTQINSDLPIIKGNIDYKDNLNAKIKIRNGSYIGGDKIGGLLILPEANDIKLDMDLKGDKSKYTFERISIISSLGNIAGEIQLELGADIMFPRTLELDLKIDLTELGAKFFSDYLKLSCKTQVDSSHQKWQVKASKSKNELFPKVETFAL